MIDQRSVSIIIPHLGESKESKYAIEKCLESLDETVPDIRKIIAFNGGKFVDTIFNEKIMYQNINWIINPRQGQCMAVNAAVATTNTPWIMVTNDDMIFLPGWWEDLTRPINSLSKFVKDMNLLCDTLNTKEELKLNSVCISPRLVEPRPGAPTFIEYFCGGAGGDFDKQKFFEFVKNNRMSASIPPRTGFNLPFLITRELWDTIGGYDINFDPWGSNGDSDLEYKIRLAGVQPYQNTNCLVYHFSQTSGTFEPRNQAHWQANWDYFIKKWGFPRTDNGIWEANFEIPDKGRIFRPSWEGKYENN